MRESTRMSVAERAAVIVKIDELARHGLTDRRPAPIRHTRLSAGSAVLAALAVAASVHGQDIYVDDDAPGGGNGQTWATAYRDLQEALVSAHNRGLPAVIRIAGGIYTPSMVARDRSASFTVTSGVTLMGGFAGRGAIQPDLNDPLRFETVLSGDLARDDGPNWTNRSDNSYTVVKVTSAAMMNLTIRGGFGAFGKASAIDAAITDGSLVELDNCRVVDNRTDRGPVVGGDRYPFTITARKTSFEHNVASAATLLIDTFRGVLDRCIIRGNQGGTESLIRFNRLEISNSLVVGNQCLGSGPLLRTWESITARGCTFANNLLGTGQLIDPGWHSEFEGNIFAPGGTICSPGSFCQRISVSPGADGWFRNNCFAPGLWISGLGPTVRYDSSNIIADPLFADPRGPDGFPDEVWDNDYRLSSDSPCVDVSSRLPLVSDPIDLIGNPRQIRGGCGASGGRDMGAYERVATECSIPARRVYVRSDLVAEGSGLSWATAKRSITSALRVPGVSEIWLAGGRYFVDNQDRESTIAIGGDVAIRGGFVGTETSLEQRPVQARTAIDGYGPTRPGVVYPVYCALLVTGAHVVLDRIEFFNGHAESAPDQIGRRGGGTRLIDSTLQATSCRWIANFAVDGGGIYADRSELRLDRCELESNFASTSDQFEPASGGAVAGFESIITVRDSVFTGNIAGGGLAQGGAIYADSKSVLQLASSRFYGNQAWVASPHSTAVASGGAIHALGSLMIVNSGFFGNLATASLAARASGGAVIGAPMQIAGSVFSGNLAVTTGTGATSGGAIYAGPGASIINSTLANNAAHGPLSSGGAVYGASTAVVQLHNSILWNNTDQSASPTPSVGGSVRSRGVISRSIIQGWSPVMGGSSVFGWNPRLTSPLGPDGLVGTDDDDLSLRAGSPAIDFADSSRIPADLFDLDADADIAEPLSRDYLNRLRFADDPGTLNAGAGSSVFLDIGAAEFAGWSCPADRDGDGSVTVGDLFTYIGDYFTRSTDADFDRSGDVTVQDILDFIDAFVSGCP